VAAAGSAVAAPAAIVDGRARDWLSDRFDEMKADVDEEAASASRVSLRRSEVDSRCEIAAPRFNWEDQTMATTSDGISRQATIRGFAPLFCSLSVVLSLEPIARSDRPISRVGHVTTRRVNVADWP
jgi:hypothetical protein